MGYKSPLNKSLRAITRELGPTDLCNARFNDFISFNGYRPYRIIDNSVGIIGNRESSFICKFFFETCRIAD